MDVDELDLFAQNTSREYLNEPKDDRPEGLNDTYLDECEYEEMEREQETLVIGPQVIEHYNGFSEERDTLRCAQLYDAQGKLDKLILDSRTIHFDTEGRVTRLVASGTIEETLQRYVAKQITDANERGCATLERVVINVYPREESL